MIFGRAIALDPTSRQAGHCAAPAGRQAMAVIGAWRRGRACGSTAKRSSGAEMPTAGANRRDLTTSPSAPAIAPHATLAPPSRTPCGTARSRTNSGVSLVTKGPASRRASPSRALSACERNWVLSAGPWCRSLAAGCSCLCRLRPTASAIRPFRQVAEGWRRSRAGQRDRSRLWSRAMGPARPRTMVNHSNRRLAGAVPDCSSYEIRRQRENKAAIHAGRIVIDDRCFPPTPIGTCCGGSKATRAERNCTSRDGSAANAAPSTSVMQMPQKTGKPGLAKAEERAGTGQSLPACASVPVSAVIEPRTSTSTFVRI
jgi:hypothetical protein